MQHVRTTQAGGSVYHSMRVKNAVFAQFHIVADNGIGPDAYSRG
jgi:hypothetical protein